MRINLILNWRAMLARAQVRIIGIKRDLFWIPFGVILPLLGVSTFIFIYKSLNVPEFAYGFVILGGAMIAYWLNILWAMASQLCWERMTGNLPHIFHRTLFYKQYSCRYGSWRYGGYISEGCLYYYWCISFKIPINFNNIWISLCLLNNIGSPLWSWHDALKCFSTFRERLGILQVFFKNLSIFSLVFSRKGFSIYCSPFCLLYFSLLWGLML
ncbi:hypothetical protein [Dictyoglomus thermophilum]|uniref:Uncharacterized protein n=1 Tax=Dictyoglomus thermophilum (strain ATCC 35947 / DSM 3960 / H-6-12) TaxID=309799 RepID=B5YAQ4_DICT6|nr:hypothetical protein [Dictyoglomus thermophilum]ACI18319.1 hypothetical protein DICTH_1713 [Dictyoglomus thermophilum H-6-12]